MSINTKGISHIARGPCRQFRKPSFSVMRENKTQEGKVLCPRLGGGAGGAALSPSGVSILVLSATPARPSIASLCLRALPSGGNLTAGPVPTFRAGRKSWRIDIPRSVSQPLTTGIGNRCMNTPTSSPSHGGGTWSTPAPRIPTRKSLPLAVVVSCLIVHLWLAVLNPSLPAPLL